MTERTDEIRERHEADCLWIRKGQTAGINLTTHADRGILLDRVEELERALKSQKEGHKLHAELLVKIAEDGGLT